MRSRSLLLLAFFSLGVVILLSIRQLDGYPFTSNSAGKISQHVRKQKIISYEAPCLCNQKYMDTSSKPTTFESERWNRIVHLAKIFPKRPHSNCITVNVIQPCKLTEIVYCTSLAMKYIFFVKSILLSNQFGLSRYSFRCSISFYNHVQA